MNDGNFDEIVFKGWARRGRNWTIEVSFHDWNFFPFFFRVFNFRRTHRSWILTNWFHGSDRKRRNRIDDGDRRDWSDWRFQNPFNSAVRKNKTKNNIYLSILKKNRFIFSWSENFLLLHFGTRRSEMKICPIDGQRYFHSFSVDNRIFDNDHRIYRKFVPRTCSSPNDDFDLWKKKNKSNII